MRYIELNPVRACMVKDPGQYRWSSYRTNGLGQDNSHLTSHPLYLDIDQDTETRQVHYRKLFRTQIDDEAINDIRLAIAQDQPVGNKRFAERIYAMTGIRRAQARRGRPNKPTEAAVEIPEKQTGFGF